MGHCEILMDRNTCSDVKFVVKKQLSGHRSASFRMQDLVGCFWSHKTGTKTAKNLISARPLLVHYQHRCNIEQQSELAA